MFDTLTGLINSEGWSSGVMVGAPDVWVVKRLLTSHPWLRLVVVDPFGSDQSYEDLIYWRAEHQYNTVIIRMRTDDAAALFEDESYDFVAINVGCDLGVNIAAWLNKPRDGGMIVGYGYDPEESPEIITTVDGWFGADVQIYPDQAWAWRCSERILF